MQRPRRHVEGNVLCWKAQPFIKLSLRIDKPLPAVDSQTRQRIQLITDGITHGGERCRRNIGFECPVGKEDGLFRVLRNCARKDGANARRHKPDSKISLVVAQHTPNGICLANQKLIHPDVNPMDFASIIHASDWDGDRGSGEAAVIIPIAAVQLPRETDGGLLIGYVSQHNAVLMDDALRRLGRVRII